MIGSLTRLCLICSVIILSGCDNEPEKPKKERAPTPSFQAKQVSYGDVANWGAGDYGLFLGAFSKTCDRLARKPLDANFGKDAGWGKVSQWLNICNTRPATSSSNRVKSWVEQNFIPFHVSSNQGEEDGLFTGYYEPELNGSRTQSDTYNVKLRSRPDDLVMVNLGDFREELRGQRIAGKVSEAGHLVPYPDRASIENGALNYNGDAALLWVDNPVDAFFLEIQGSGVVTLDTGEEIRVGYAGQNGHVYTAIGKTLIEMGEIPRELVSLQTIRAWLEANPSRAVTIMNSNKSYVFFQETGLDGAQGGEGVIVTPQASLAIDHGLYPYGLPIWVNANMDGLGNMKNFSQLMVGQDTGGAIKGAVRGDVFWGHGARAKEIAGNMKAKGQMWLILPKFVTFDDIQSGELLK